MMSDTELFETLTKNPAVAWKQKDAGMISVNKNAGIVIAKAINSKGFDAFYSLNPKDIQLILHEGKIRLFDDEIKHQLEVYHFPISQFSKININGKNKYVYGDVHRLINEILFHNREIHFPVNVESTLL
jgi:hypothetical protein